MKSWTIHIILILSAVLLTANSYAQNNKFKINDAAYAYFDKGCNIHLKEEVCLLYADSMLQVATRVKDNKAIVISYFLRNTYYFYQKDVAQIKVSLDELKKQTDRLGFKAYYFAAYRNLITIYRSQKNEEKALSVLHKLQKEAVAANEPYAISQCYMTEYDIYNNRCDLTQMKFCLDKAMEYSIKNKNRNKEKTYIDLAFANLYILTQQDQKATTIVDQILNDSLTFKNQQLRAACMGLAISARNQNWTDYKRYLNIVSHMDGENINSWSLSFIYYHFAVVLYNIHIGDTLTAANHLHVLKIKKLGGSEKMIMEAAQNFYFHNKDYKKAYSDLVTYVQTVDNYRKSINAATQSSYLAEFEQDRLKLINSKLRMQQMQLEMRNMLREQHLLKLENEHSQLDAQKKDREIQKQKLLINQNRILNQIEKEHLTKEKTHHSLILAEEQIRLKTSRITIIVACLILCMSCIYIWERNKSMKLLKKKKMESVNAMQQAQEADKRKTTFIQNISHEIRTPLNAIVGYNEILNGEDSFAFSPEERQEFLQAVHTNSELLSNLIEDILTKSRMESGMYKLQYTSLSPQTFCIDNINKVRNRCKEGVEIDFKIANNEEITCDAHLLQLIMNNFLTNACKYTTEGKITLEYYTQDESICFVVSDTGMGIPKEKAEDIFNPFTKLDTFYQGTGLGLNIARIAARMLGGDAQLDTSYEGGARFVCSILNK